MGNLLNHMNKSTKIIILFYLFLAISYTSFVFYTDYTFSDAVFGNETFDATEDINLVTPININKTKLFDTMTDLEKYSLILPENFVSVKIINHSGNVIYAEEEISEKFIKEKFLVKHTINPYDSHVVEILDGDAKGTVISQTFEGDDTKTVLTTQIKFQLEGILSTLTHFPRAIIVDKVRFANDAFVKYAQGFDDETKKIVDDMYREILKRPADPEGFQYWGSLLESGKITVDEMREEFYNSKEYHYLLSFEQRKSVDELKDETKKIVDDMYREILKRPADTEGFEYWGSLLESGKITVAEMREEFYNSYEYNTYIKNTKN